MIATCIANLFPRRQLLHSAFAKALDQHLLDKSSIKRSDVYACMDDASHIDDKIMELEPTSFMEAKLQLGIACERICLEWGDKLDEQDELFADDVKALQEAVVNLWKFCSVKNNS